MSDLAPSSTPDAYARHLAGYIGNPSTVRARTIEEFGKAPDLEKIARWCDHSKSPRAQTGDDAACENADLAPPANDEPVFDVPPWIIRPLFADELIAQVARSFGLTVEDIRGRSREAYIVRVRGLLVRLLLDRGHSTPVIGRWLRRDHSSVLHARDRFPEVAARHPAIAEAYAHFRREWGMDREAVD